MKKALYCTVTRGVTREVRQFFTSRRIICYLRAVHPTSATPGIATGISNVRNDEEPRQRKVCHNRIQYGNYCKLICVQEASDKGISQQSGIPALNVSLRQVVPIGHDATDHEMVTGMVNLDDKMIKFEQETEDIWSKNRHQAQDSMQGHVICRIHLPTL